MGRGPHRSRMLSAWQMARVALFVPSGSAGWVVRDGTRKLATDWRRTAYTLVRHA